MTISLETRTVFHCKCVRCGHEWETLKKPPRCASCKVPSWNGEDYRRKDPFANVPPTSKLALGTKPPKLNYRDMLATFLAVKEILVQLIADLGPCNHAKNECVCHEQQVLASVETQIEGLKSARITRQPAVQNS